MEEKDRPRIERYTFSHEIMGVIDEVGSSVQNLAFGDRVMVPFNILCGTCWYCARGLYSNCHNRNPNAAAVGGIYGVRSSPRGADTTTMARRSVSNLCVTTRVTDRANA